MDYRKIYEEHLNSPFYDEEYKNELEGLNEKEIEDRFFTELKFGTAGIRGVIGSGTNRINKYLIRKVTRGFGEYLISEFDEPKVVIAYDSRRKSDEFSKEAALMLAGMGIQTFLFREVTTTPELSFAVRELSASGGIVITASHNPPEYNGYKIYDETGCQVHPHVANKVIENVNSIHDLSVLKPMNEEEALRSGMLEYVGEKLYLRFYEEVEKLLLNRKTIEEKGKELSIVFTPLHGTGYRPVKNVLENVGFANIHYVKEQIKPDGEFPTENEPNPENVGVFELAMELGRKEGADILLATDPDADRIGALVLHEGEYRKINGNQMGALLADYITEYRHVKNGVVINTVVSSHMVDALAKEKGFRLEKTLTGFKYIGEKITSFEGTSVNFLLGFEESYGYMSGSHVRDKDAVNAAALVAEMALMSKLEGKTLIDRLDDMFGRIGYFLEDQIVLKLEGKEGAERIKHIIADFSKHPLTEICGSKLKSFIDYRLGPDSTGLPESDVLKYVYEGEDWFAVRPSGTEPKLKIYVGVREDSNEKALKRMADFKETLLEKLGG